MNILINKLLDDVLGSWRFKWIALLVAAAICLIGWVYILTLPSTYEASARVYVDTQSALRPLLQGLAVAPNVESSLAIVRQALLSDRQLEIVARDVGLDRGVKNAKQKELLLDGLRQSIVIAADGRATGTTTDGMYRISFQSRDRTNGVAVVKTLLNSFVGDTLSSKRSGQEVAQQFLRDQIADYEKRLATSEQRLADFKKQNVGRMPDQRGDYFTRLQTEANALEDARKSLSVTMARRDELKRQLSGEDPFVFGFDTDLAAANSGSSGDILVRIQELEKKEQELLVRFTEAHPEVVAVRKQIEDLHVREEEELQRMRQGKSTGGLAQSTKANPVYQSMKLELNKSEVQVAELQRNVAQQSDKVAQLRKLIDTVPQVEADVARLNRDYEVTRAQYLQLVQRLETAKISENADESGTVKFEIIDPPASPSKPVSPNRSLLLTAVLIFGIAAGGALAYLLNLIRPVFRSARALVEYSGLQVIGSVSTSWNQLREPARRRDLYRYFGSFASLLLLFIVVLVVNESAAALLARR